MEQPMQRPILLAIAAAAALSFATFATPASADTTFAAPASADTQRISFQGIDGSSPAGAHLMLERIRFAADYVCHVRSGPQQLWEKMQAKHCVENTVSRTVQRLNNPMLTAALLGTDNYAVAMN
jgi:UrcA family protein